MSNNYNKKTAVNLRQLLKLAHKDSNLEMTESESVALPFGDGPLRFNRKHYKTIKNEMFYNCSKLKEIKLGKNVESIQYDAFAYSGIESIVIPKNVTTLGYGELKDCSQGMFDGCKKLKLVEFRSKKIDDVYKTTFLNTPKDAVFRVPQGKLEEYTKLFREGGLAEDIVIEESTEW